VYFDVVLFLVKVHTGSV